MYNKDKPQKYRVDFFVLADASTYAILHLDVYQGKHTTDLFMHEKAKGLPITQAAVVNAVCTTLLNVPSNHGFRYISLDNRYGCPQLAVFLRDICSMYSTGTVRTNRIGWDTEIMNLSKKKGRGDHLFGYDKVNRVLFGKWNDSKVVNFVSSYIDTSITSVKRQVS